MTLDCLLSRLSRVRRSGSGYVALCPAHDDRKPSLSIGERSDRVLLHCFVGCSVKEICEALGIHIRDLFTSGAGRSNLHRTDAERRDYARRSFWQPSRLASNTIVETYLRSRAITIPVPPAIRFIPTLFHCEYGWPFPALVAGLQDAAGAFAGVSITWLCADGSDKAPVEPTRKIYGPYRGSAARLAPAGETLVLAEGLETGLSVAEACPELPVWCALTATNLHCVELPECVAEVIVCADNDEPGLEAARKAVTQFICAGRRAKVATPHMACADFNDELRA
jgi:hypothetical protein